MAEQENQMVMPRRPAESGQRRPILSPAVPSGASPHRSRSSRAPRRNSRRQLRGKAGPLGLVLLASAGGFKAIPAVAAFPVDLTLLAFSLVAGMVFVRVVIRRQGIPEVIGQPLLLLAVLFASSLWAESSEYGNTKAIQLVTTTAACLLAPMILIRTREQLRVLFGGIAVVGVVLSLGTLTRIADAGYERAAAFGGSPLHVATFGSGLVVLSVLDAAGHLHRVQRALVGFVLATLGIFAVAASGTRAALAGVPIALILTFMLSRRRRGGRWLQILVVVPVLVIGFNYGRQVAPDGAAGRLGASNLTSGSSVGARQGAYESTLPILKSKPFGVGLGDWAQEVPEEVAYLQYPHNILLEVGADAGWLALAVVVSLLLTALRQAHTYSSTLEGRLLFGLIVFLLLQALARGDVNSNRVMWVVASTCLVLPRLLREAEPQEFPAPKRPGG